MHIVTIRPIASALLVSNKKWFNKFNNEQKIKITSKLKFESIQQVIGVNPDAVNDFISILTRIPNDAGENYSQTRIDLFIEYMRSLEDPEDALQENLNTFVNNLMQSKNGTNDIVQFLDDSPDYSLACFLVNLILKNDPELKKFDKEKKSIILKYSTIKAKMELMLHLGIGKDKTFTPKRAYTFLEMLAKASLTNQSSDVQGSQVDEAFDPFLDEELPALTLERVLITELKLEAVSDTQVSELAKSSEKTLLEKLRLQLNKKRKKADRLGENARTSDICSTFLDRCLDRLENDRIIEILREDAVDFSIVRNYITRDIASKGQSRQKIFDLLINLLTDYNEDDLENVGVLTSFLCQSSDSVRDFFHYCEENREGSANHNLVTLVTHLSNMDNSDHISAILSNHYIQKCFEFTLSIDFRKIEKKRKVTRLLSKLEALPMVGSRFTKRRERRERREQQEAQRETVAAQRAGEFLDEKNILKNNQELFSKALDHSIDKMTEEDLPDAFWGTIFTYPYLSTTTIENIKKIFKPDDEKDKRDDDKNNQAIKIRANFENIINILDAWAIRRLHSGPEAFSDNRMSILCNSLLCYCSDLIKKEIKKGSDLGVAFNRALVIATEIDNIEVFSGVEQSKIRLIVREARRKEYLALASNEGARNTVAKAFENQGGSSFMSWWRRLRKGFTKRQKEQIGKPTRSQELLTDGHKAKNGLLLPADITKDQEDSDDLKDNENLQITSLSREQRDDVEEFKDLFTHMQEKLKKADELLNKFKKGKDIGMRGLTTALGHCGHLGIAIKPIINKFSNYRKNFNNAIEACEATLTIIGKNLPNKVHREWEKKIADKKKLLKAVNKNFEKAKKAAKKSLKKFGKVAQHQLAHGSIATVIGGSSLPILGAVLALAGIGAVAGGIASGGGTTEEITTGRTQEQPAEHEKAPTETVDETLPAEPLVEADEQEATPEELGTQDVGTPPEEEETTTLNKNEERSQRKAERKRSNYLKKITRKQQRRKLQKERKKQRRSRSRSPGMIDTSQDHTTQQRITTGIE